MTQTSITRLQEKGRDDRETLDGLLDYAMAAHVAIVRDGAPVVFPTGFARDGDRLLIHGSTGSPWMRAAASGIPVCVEITSFDGMLVARSTFESSMHYRSAIFFGVFETLEGDEKEAALDVLVDRLIPGRSAEVRRPTKKELAATLVLALPMTEWSLKVSAGWPDDLPEDLPGDAWAGVVPLRESWGDPIPAPDLRAGIPVPDSVRRLGATR